jgi:hypothetical protein
MAEARPNCFILFRQAVRLAFSLALARAGNNIAASMAIIAMTTKSSIKVKAGPRTAAGFFELQIIFSTLIASW